LDIECSDLTVLAVHDLSSFNLEDLGVWFAWGQQTLTLSRYLAHSNLSTVELNILSRLDYELTSFAAVMQILDVSVLHSLKEVLGDLRGVENQLSLIS
jgi:hypothetical protein